MGFEQLSPESFITDYCDWGREVIGTGTRHGVLPEEFQDGAKSKKWEVKTTVVRKVGEKYQFTISKLRELAVEIVYLLEL